MGRLRGATPFGSLSGAVQLLLVALRPIPPRIAPPNMNGRRRTGISYRRQRVARLCIVAGCESWAPERLPVGRVSMIEASSGEESVL